MFKDNLDDRFATSNPAWEITYEMAEKFYMRLVRIWNLEEIQKIEFHRTKSYLRFSAPLGEEAKIEFYRISGENEMFVSSIDSEAILICTNREFGMRKNFNTRVSEQTVSRRHNIADNYMLMFRRNCWLMGFDIESSATEKSLWLQDFADEFNLWELRF